MPKYFALVHIQTTILYMNKHFLQYPEQAIFSRLFKNKQVHHRFRDFDRLFARKDRHDVSLGKSEIKTHKLHFVIIFHLFVKSRYSLLQELWHLHLQSCHSRISHYEESSPVQVCHNFHKTPKACFFFWNKAKKKSNYIIVALAVSNFWVHLTISSDYVSKFYLARCKVCFFTLIFAI